MRRHILPAFALLLALSATSEAAGTEVAANTSIMTLNIYGYATMPDQAPAYARLVSGHGIDVLAIQEGVDDWQIVLALPVDYSRA